jgi:hypothetical protein
VFFMPERSAFFRRKSIGSTQLLGELVDHHLGGRHALQRAVAARGTGVDRTGGDGHRGGSFFGK